MQSRDFKLDYLPPNFVPYHQRITIMRDIWDGLRLCDRSQYLYRKSGERQDFYQKRLKSAVFQDRVRKAIEEFAGVLSLNHSIKSDNTPKEIISQLNNVDGNGSNFSVWLNVTLQKLLRDGCIGWFVAYDDAIGLWKLVGVDPMSVRAPIVLNDNGKYKIQAFTIESIENKVSGFATKPETVYYRHEIVEDEQGKYYQYTKFVKDNRVSSGFRQEGDPIIPVIADGTRLTKIPLIWLSLAAEKIPLSFEFSFFSTLADLSIQQFNKVSELDTAESSSNIATLTVYHPSDVPDDLGDIYVGDGAVINVAHAQYGGKIEYLEPTGNAMQSTHQRNTDRSELMDKIAKQFITGDSTEKTKYQVAVEVTSVQAQLLTLVAFIQDAIEQTFDLIAKYTNPKPLEYAGGITIDNEAIRPPIDPETLRYYQELTDQGYLTTSEFKQLLQLSGAFPRGFNVLF